MKIQLLVLVYILFIVSCKSPIGLYCSPPNYTAFCYDLKKDGKFIYDSASCTGGSRGIGDYEIKDDTLKFNFRKHEIKRGGYKIEKTKELKNEIIIHLTAVDSQSRESVIFYDALIYSDGIFIGGKNANSEGKVQLQTPYKGKSIEVKTQFVMYHPINIEIKEEGEYWIFAELVQGWHHTEPEQERVYRIIELNKDNLVIGNFEGDDWNETLYRKKHKKKQK